MRKILILMGRYLPGHRDGGPLRTIVNLTDALGDEYDFNIVCLDRDQGDKKAYSNILYNKWNRVGKANVLYVHPGGFTFSLIKKLSKEMDLLYICGFYNDYAFKTLILNKFKQLYGRTVFIASMGVFSAGALSQKSFKKNIYIKFCKHIGLFKNVKWSVTSSMEENDVKRVIGENANCVIAEDLPRMNVPGRRKGG